MLIGSIKGSSLYNKHNNENRLSRSMDRGNNNLELDQDDDTKNFRNSLLEEDRYPKISILKGGRNPRLT